MLGGDPLKISGVLYCAALSSLIVFPGYGSCVISPPSLNSISSTPAGSDSVHFPKATA